MSEQVKFLNSVVATEIINVLSPLKHNIETAINLIVSSQNCYLTVSDVEYLNSLSLKSVRALNDLIINPNLGIVNNDHITLFRYNSFNSSNKKFYDTPIYENSFTTNNFNNISRVPYSALFLQDFIDFDCDNKLVPHQYNIDDITVDVINNLTIIINIINQNIKHFDIFCN